MPLKLKIIIGSIRPGRVGPTIAKWAEQFAIEHNKFAVEVVDLADIKLPLLDEATHPMLGKYENEPTKRWSAIIGDADAFVFVTPEYDFFPPASVVNAVQVLMREWAYKPSAVISYGGISAGLRAAQGLRQLLGNVNNVAIVQGVPVPMFPQFIEDGVFKPNDKMAEGAQVMFDELHRWAETLKTMREPRLQAVAA